MEGTIRVRLEPLGVEVEAARGDLLRDLLFAHGLEFPCGGRGDCRGCRVKVLRGLAPPTQEEIAALTAVEIAEGWRLGCRIRPAADIALEIAQWEAVVLCDDTPVEFTPREGLGIAVDLGTTTLVAQLVDLQSGHVLGVQTALNPQAAYGSDVMSRVELALSPEGAGKLKEAIRRKVGELVAQLSGVEKLRDIVIVGNTVMHHLFCGIDVEPLSHVPFQSSRGRAEFFRAGDLGWNVSPETSVKFLSCLGGFVGSDVLAGVVATRIAESDDLAGLIDLGTNGEIVFGNRERLVCASTAAGPAFEGGRIAMGMRAATGAIASVQSGPGGLRCEALGGGPPRGICGSGLVDAVAVGLELGAISHGGRLPHDWMLADGVSLTQSDVRELQLAKAAVAAGIRILLQRLGTTPADVTRLYLAGAFGNYVNRDSARRIGLIGFSDDVVVPAGNAALRGAKLALFRNDAEDETLRQKIEHISLAADPDFQKTYVEEMQFPASAG